VLSAPAPPVLRNDIADELRQLIIAQDKADGLSRADRVKPDDVAKGVSYTIPPHDAGESSSSWKLVGPPHIQRYLNFTPPQKEESSSQRRRLETLLVSLTDLLASPSFRYLLAALTSLVPLSHAIEARRFRPGLDYTLARGEIDDSVRLDLALGLTVPSTTPTAGGEDDWESGQVGGWDIWLAGETDSDEATYGAGGGGRGDDEDDGPLLTLPPDFNRLHLVLRDPGVLRFVKYVSSRAPAARWDVSGEWEIGQVEEDEEEEEGEAQ
jgi:hypothetical protein